MKTTETTLQEVHNELGRFFIVDGGEAFMTAHKRIKGGNFVRVANNKRWVKPIHPIGPVEPTDKGEFVLIEDCWWEIGDLELMSLDTEVTWIEPAGITPFLHS